MMKPDRAAVLMRGRKNLTAMKTVAAKPTTSPAGKKTLAEMIVKQKALIASLEMALGTEAMPEA